MSHPFRLVTFNIRCPWEGDGINTMPHRLGSILCTLDRELPDAVCFQEVVPETAEFLEKHLPDYTVLYLGRCEHYDGEGLAVALRRETVELLAQDFFWLSPTPYVPASRYPIQSGCPRICQVVLIRLRGTDQPFWIYNNHLDHIGDPARLLGIQQVIARIRDDREKVCGSVFVLGDFNAFPDSTTVQYCSNNTVFPLKELTAKCGMTFHNFGKESNYPQIDYIFADPETAAKPHTLTKWTDNSDGIYLSDHYPLCLDMEL